jgi:hypothetical protein
MLTSDIHGFTDWTTRGNQFASACAASLLRSPDQLMKIFMDIFLPIQFAGME